MENIRKKVERVFDLDITTKSRQQKYIYARACYYMLCTDLTANSLTAIADSVDKTHATIIHALKEFPYMCKSNLDLKTKYHLLKKEMMGLNVVKKPEDLLYNYHRILLENIDLKSEIKQLRKNLQQAIKQIK